MSANNTNTNVATVFGQQADTTKEGGSVSTTVMKHAAKAVQTVQYELNVAAKFGHGLYNMVKENQPKHAERAKAEVADVLAEFFL